MKKLTPEGRVPTMDDLEMAALFCPQIATMLQHVRHGYCSMAEGLIWLVLMMADQHRENLEKWTEMFWKNSTPKLWDNPRL